MAGYMAGLSKQADGLGNQGGAIYDQIFGSNVPKEARRGLYTPALAQNGTTPIAPQALMQGGPQQAQAQPQGNLPTASPQMGKGSLTTGPGYSQYMGNAQAPDMSHPQQQGNGMNEIASLMSILQGGGQMGRRRA
jgi:hypothetical protein